MRTAARVTDTDILRKVRRYGPLKTPVLLKLTGLPPRGSLERLRRCQGLQRRLVNGVNVWSA